MARVPIADELFVMLLTVMIGLVRRDGADLTARGLSILLTVDTMPGPHTVRGMAERLNVSKPAVTRTLDRLEVLGLVRRDVDTADRRSVLVRATKTGAAYVTRVGRLAKQAMG